MESFDVFISYSRADDRIADYIFRALSEIGLKVFYDKSSISSESFPKRLSEGILCSKVLLFLASANSVSANYAPDELVFAKNNKPRNSIIVYRIDSCRFPSDIELLLSSLNHRDSSSDSIHVIIDDIYQILAKGEISNFPKVSKSTDEDENFKKLYNSFLSFDFYSIVFNEIKNRYWEYNWNHHLLLMKTYEIVGDRHNYSILLKNYQNSGIYYYPKFYGLIPQIWDMIKMGFSSETHSHIKNIASQIVTREDKICSDVNYSHILLLAGHSQDAINYYVDISKRLTKSELYQYLLKDFDTIKWTGFNSLSESKFKVVSSSLGYSGRNILTSISGHNLCKEYENLLVSKRWHYREQRTHIVLAFKIFNGSGNTIYYFEERDKNILGRLFNVLPYGLDETNTILRNGKAFCQYRLSIVKGCLILEEYNPLTEQISIGEIVKLNAKELHIKVLDNGNISSRGEIRKFKAID